MAGCVVHRAKKWEPVFGKKRCAVKELDGTGAGKARDSVEGQEKAEKKRVKAALSDESIFATVSQKIARRPSLRRVCTLRTIAAQSSSSVQPPSAT
ncbi:hypothetical protein [Sandaracinobacteroides saxicola]|uniref:Uncharacterized protein n=1 Tax=Sandaracinobacteroides saxicola TaxID=2759707 RepID=A0A7G5IG26_9SPHN|nr:hypothetical protein [Sandaracinobacteroides saxicola]QMW22318.1 hypothetical protein H3309_13290 [Sandaracinobacteroides saxicola]